jgi:hypothetical protein
VRLALDVHLSDRRVGEPLRADGHDVAAAQLPSQWASFEDVALLRACAAEDRILISAGGKDFRWIAVDFADRGETHAGLLLVVGTRSTEPSRLLTAIRRTLETYPSQDAWRDVTLVVGAAS